MLISNLHTDFHETLLLNMLISNSHTDFHETLLLSMLISNSHTDFHEIQTKGSVTDARLHNGKQAKR